MKRFIITTTNNIEGQVIKDYLKPVSANVVIGTNVFSDFAAAFSDFFGGRSNTYERKLQQLYDAAMHKLEIVARSMGAGGIVGLKIDMDEVGGAGKQMFMITAYGTPVVMASQHADVAGNGLRIDGILVKNRMKAKKLLRMKGLPGELYTDDYIQFVLESKLPEFVDYALNGLKHYTLQDTVITSGAEEAGKKVSALSEYFSYLLPEIYAEKLFRQFYETNQVSYLQQLMKIISVNDLIDYNVASSMIKSDNMLAAKFGLSMLAIERPYYTKADVPFLNELISAVTEEFPPLGKVGTKKKVLGGEREVWNCACGGTNEMDAKYCEGCGKDIYGFARAELKPSEVVEILNERISTISEEVAWGA